MASVITLNVGGKIMSTYKSTLEQLDYFQSKLDRWNADNTDIIFIDYDPELFIHLLNKLRDDGYTFPNDENIIAMCDYFGYKIETKIDPINFVLKGFNEKKMVGKDCCLVYCLDTTINKILLLRIKYGYEKGISVNKIIIFNGMGRAVLNITEDLMGIFFKPANHKKNASYKKKIMRKVFLKELNNMGNIKICFTLKEGYYSADPSSYIDLLVKQSTLSQ